MNEISVEERQRRIEDILELNRQGRETLGTAIRRLRVEVTGLDQETFASMCRMSTKALYQLETDRGNPTLNTLNGILRLFGMTMALAPLAPVSGLVEEAPTPMRRRGTRPPGRASASR